MTPLEQFLKDLAARENPTPKEVFEAAVRLKLIGMEMLYTKVDNSVAAEDVRRRMGVGA